MKRILLSAGMLCASLFASAQCDPQTTLNEDFTDFNIASSNAFPQNCWTAIAGTFQTGGPLVYTAQTQEPSNQYATFYASTAVNTAGYLISPEVSTFDGAHQLSFSAWKLAGQGGAVPAGTVTIQVGTITNVADAATFVPFGEPISVTTGTAETHSNIVLPANTTAGTHIAFKVSADTVHNAIAIDNVTWDAIPAPVCEAVATIDENFTAFAGGAFPQNCWTSSHQAPMTSVDADEEGSEEKAVTVYSFFSPNTPIYVVSPEVSTIDGEHALSFTANIQTGSMPGGTSSLQIGTLSDPADFSTFVPFGDAIALTSTATTYNNIVLPASATHRYIAFQFTASLAHVAAALDNVVWDVAPVVTPVCEAVATIDENFTAFAGGAFPQNCWTSSHQAPMTSVDADEEGSEEKAVTVYSFFSPNTPIYVVSPEVSTIDGEHALSFTANIQTGSMPGGASSLQIGTLSDPADFSTFVPFGDAIALTSTATTYDNIVLPASATHRYIAFQFTASLAHVAAALDNVVWDVAPVVTPVCEAVATIDENFTAFAGGAFPQNCWTSSHQAPMTSVDADEEGSEEKAVTVYSFFSPNTPIYVVSPEVSTIDGEHELSFTANIQTGSMPGGASSLQIGTLSDPADFSTFVPFGDAIALTSTATTYNNIVLPASATHRYIAFQFTASLAHVAAALDNVVWASSVAGTGSVKANAFSIFPNPSTNKNVTLTYNNLTTGHVSVYAVTGAKVFETAVSGNTQNINLSALASGMYVVKLESGNVSATQKLIIK